MDTPFPSHVASPEFPQVEGTGAELFAAGYHQLSSKYRIFAQPPREDTTLGEMLAALAQAAPMHHRWLQDFIRRQIVEAYFREAAPRVGLSDQQFADFKHAQRTGIRPKWHYDQEPIPHTQLTHNKAPVRKDDHEHASK